MDYELVLLNSLKLHLMDYSLLLNSVALFAIMFVFNFIGATTGGSALLTIPACIFLGFSPAAAVATTRVGVLGSTLAGWYGFKNKVNYKIGVTGAICAGCGAVLGAYFMVSLSPVLLQRGLGIVMLIVLGLAILRKKSKNTIVPSPPSGQRKFVGYVGLSATGFLSGMFGGQGVILNYILVTAFRQPFLEAAGTRTIINLIIAAVAILVYQESRVINWHYAAIILVAMSLGTYLGTLYGLKKGEKWVERTFTIVALLMAVKLMW